MSRMRDLDVPVRLRYRYGHTFQDALLLLHMRAVHSEIVKAKLSFGIRWWHRAGQDVAKKSHMGLTGGNSGLLDGQRPANLRLWENMVSFPISGSASKICQGFSYPEFRLWRSSTTGWNKKKRGRISPHSFYSFISSTQSILSVLKSPSMLLL